MSRSLLLLLLLPLAACSRQTPYATTVGLLKPGATLEVRVASATLNAYQPSAGQSRRAFTISATALSKQTPPPAPALRPGARGVIVNAPGPLASLLVRVPDGVDFVVRSERGDVNVTDINASARIIAQRGNVKVMLPGYAQAAVGQGNLSVTMGSTDWPGTLHFSTQNGNIELWIIATAAFHVHLHTDDGSLFTDFGLRGTSQGRSETIDANVNGGGGHGIDVEAASGTIRLLRLTPQP